MGTKNFDNATDLITFSRASKGTALRRVGYGPELVTNGTFDTDVSGWSTAGASLTFDSGAASVTTSGNYRGIYQVQSLVVGKAYLVSADVLSTSSSVYLKKTDSSITVDTNVVFGPSTSGPASLSFVFFATSTSPSVGILAHNSGTSFIVDNFSVKEVLFDRASDPLVLFNHPDNIPRIDYDASGNPKGLLIEEQRTNLVTYSDVNTTNWTAGSYATISSQAVSNPLGLSSVVKVTPTTDNVGQAYGRVVTKAINRAVGTTYTYSAFVKADGYNAAYIIFTDRVNVYGGAAFDLTDGSFIEADGANTGVLSNSFIENYGDGWYRIGFTHDGGGAIDASNGVGVGFVPTGLANIVDHTQTSFAGDGTSGGYVVGVQVEQGSFPTSYIPTSGASATRSADIASIPVSAFGYNQKAGTVVVEWNSDGDNNPHIVNFNTDTNNRWVIYLSGGSQKSFISDGGSIVMDSVIASAPSGDNKSAMSISASSGNGVINGGTVVSDTSVSVPTVSSLAIGKSEVSGNLLNGHIKSIKYYPRRLTNAQLQELTS